MVAFRIYMIRIFVVRAWRFLTNYSAARIRGIRFVKLAQAIREGLDLRQVPGQQAIAAAGIPARRGCVFQ